MTVIRTEDNNGITLSLDGRLDTLTAPELEKVVDDDGINKLTLDFSKLEYISSAGLRVLLALHKKLSNKGGLTVANVNDVVLDVFNATGFTNVLNIV